MSFAIAFVGIVGFLAALLHFASIATVVARVRRRRAPSSLIRPGSPVTLIRPVCGLENGIEETLATSFALRHRPLEILFCVEAANDPVIAVVERLIARHPDVDARLLVGSSTATGNPKLNNMLKGWDAARHPWVAMVDSNVLMPPDQIARMIAAWSANTGLVCSPPLGSRPASIAAELECAILNTYQARWQLFADSAGFGFAQGKAMLVNRAFLARRGGLRALGEEPAEDAAITKIVRAAGLRVRLAQTPFPQPLGQRSFVEVWRRQVRWGKLRRDTFPLAFLPEVLAGGLPPILAAGLVAAAADVPPIPAALGLAVGWYGAEAVLAWTAGWPLHWRSVLLWIARDLMLPAVWVASWLGNTFVWRGNAMSLEPQRSVIDLQTES